MSKSYMYYEFRVWMFLFFCSNVSARPPVALLTAVTSDDTFLNSSSHHVVFHTPLFDFCLNLLHRTGKEYWIFNYYCRRPVEQQPKIHLNAISFLPRCIQNLQTLEKDAEKNDSFVSCCSTYSSTN